MQAVATPTLRCMGSDAASGIPSQVDTCDVRGMPNETAWRTFRKRLFGQLESNEWSSAKPPSIVQGVAGMLRHALGASSCTVFLPNGNGGGLGSWRSTGGNDVVRIRSDELSEAAEWVMQHATPLVLNEAGDWSQLAPAGDNRGQDNRVLCVPVTAAGRVIGAIQATRPQLEPSFTERDLDTALVTGATTGTSIENNRLRESVEEGYRSTIRALASAIDAKDPYTCGHSQSVAQYSLVAGLVLNLGVQEMQTLETAALLHDIGKIGIDDAILRKPRRLTPAERAAVKDHPVIGAAIIHDIASLREVVELVLHHHEAFDGSGYPHGLRGEQIPLGARLIAVADAFDSMTTNRPYRAALTINAAMNELARCRGTQFCPQALDAFAVGFTRYYDDLPQRRRVLHRQGAGPIPMGQ